MTLKDLEEDDLIDTVADLVLDAMDGDEETVRQHRSLRKLSQAEEPTPQNPEASTTVEKNLVKALKLGMTFTFTVLSEGKTPDGLSSMILDGIFHVIGYSPPPETEDEILETVKRIEHQNAAMANRLNYLSAENKNEFRLNDMNKAYVELKTIHTQLHKKMKIDADEALTFLLGERRNVENWIEKAHNFLISESDTRARDGRRLQAIEAIQAHLWSKLESTDNFEYYGIQSYLIEARWFAKRMAKIQYLGTSLLEMMAELWTLGEDSPYDDAGIANYRQDIQDTFTKRIAKYEQTLLTVHGHGRIERWPSTKFIMQQGDMKEAGSFPQLCRLQIGDNDLVYKTKFGTTISQQQNAYRDGDRRSAWAFHQNENDTFGLATSADRFTTSRRDARKLRGEAITTSYTTSLVGWPTNEKVGRFKVIPQPGGDASSFSIRIIDFANSPNEVTDLKVIPTAQHSPAVRLLRPDSQHHEVAGRIPYLAEPYDSFFKAGKLVDCEINVFNASSRRNRVVVLNEVSGDSGDYDKYEAIAASHCIATNRDDQKHTRILCRRVHGEATRMWIKLKVYWIEDGDVSDERLAKAFRRSPIRGRPCLGGSGIKEVADVFVDLDLIDGVFWWENSTIKCDVTPPQEPPVGDIDRYNFEGWELKAEVQGTKRFDQSNLVIGASVSKGSRAVANIVVAGLDDFATPHD